MKTLYTIAILAVAFATSFQLPAAEYARYAINSVTVPLNADNSFGLNVGGADIDLLDNTDEVIPPSFALAPFQFHPRDFSVSEVTSIDSIRLGFRNDISFFTDDAPVQVFYVPDSSTDFDVPVVEDDEFGNCTFGTPFNCYDLEYDSSSPNGIDPSQFSSAPILLGQIDVLAIGPPAVGDPTNEDFIKDVVDLNTDAAESMISRINAGQGFHLLFGAVDSDSYVEIGSFNTNRTDGPGADVRPELIIDASGVAAGITKDLNHHGSIHSDGDNTSGDFYGSGNDDGFSEYGIANFQFSKDDLGVSEDVSDINSIQLTLHHNERGFSDGDMVEFFFTSDTAAELGYDEDLGYDVNLTYDADLENGIDEEQYANNPISLGTYEYTPKFGGNADTFDLELPDDAKEQLIASLNAGDDFHLIIASPEPESDITFAGFENAFDPGNPQLTISVGSGSGPTCVVPDGVIAGDLDSSGDVSFADFLVLSQNFGSADVPYASGDIDCDGSVAFADFLVLSQNFGQSAAAQSVPEPSTWVLLGFGAGFAGLLRRRRR